MNVQRNKETKKKDTMIKCEQRAKEKKEKQTSKKRNR